MKPINLTRQEFMQRAAALGLVATVTTKVSLGASETVLQRLRSEERRV